MIKFKILKAEDYCDSVRDGTHDSPKKTDSGYKLITSKHIKEYGLDLDSAYCISEKDFNKVNERSAVNINDILYSMIGTIGLMYRVESQPNYAIKNMGLFKISDEIKSKWLYYYLKSPKMKNYIKSLLNGSTQQYIILSNLRQIPIEMPENEGDMKKIIKVLDLIDKKIQINTKTNDNLEELMQTLYQRWFIEFNFPNEEGKPYKASGGKMVWNEELKQEIPEGWKVENLYKNSLSSIIKNGVDKFEKKIYLETADITNDFISNGNEISFNNRPSRANMQPQLNSIWFAKMKNSVKHLSLAESSNAFVNKYILSTGMYGLQCDKKTFPYMHSFINSIYFESTKDKLAHGATQQAVNDNDIKNIKIICPNNSIIEKYSNKTYSILEEKNLIQEENKRLTELRDFLLPMLMNGQINVDDVEI